MRSSVLFSRLQNLTKIDNISQSVIAKIINVSQPVIANRIKRDSNFSDDEIVKIQEHYGVSLINDSSNTLILDYYPNIFGSCGSGSMVFDESSEKMSITKEQISNYSNAGKYSIISARGSSMSPTICDEDLLILQHNLEKTIVDNTIYLFKYNDELFIKRLVKNIDQIICISENPRFEDRVIIPKNNNFEIIGKVVGLIRKKV